MLILFPADYFNPKTIDSAFSNEANTFKACGAEIASVVIEGLESGELKTKPTIHTGDAVLYRGWMLPLAQYEFLVQSVEKMGGMMLISTSEYAAAHYLPNWYPLISHLTPETRFYKCDENLVDALEQLGWEKFFIKDHVKSLKTSLGSIVETPQDITAVVLEMQKFRGQIEGGLCVRRIENWVNNSEQRYFIWQGNVYAAKETVVIPDLVRECAQIIPSSFFSIDVVETVDGRQRVVEIGDGQVSDLVGWTPEEFTRIWF
ncbi:ATP-grasp domain-containing protein [Microcoleus sp. FACHB-672]|uniref:ATP-grasp domain-containing protein n=1 Tax=Microcoleus sp. FACHB-672 TaxID=2692825 RepID=UPI0016887D21|nr:ATP-grasp domain-containing protein [Microcoleus sp. FACHB-672]MBD2039750.1 ATP-grasp domain-containing protein [Microcoleus sp. FACHB-672]